MHWAYDDIINQCYFKKKVQRIKDQIEFYRVINETVENYDRREWDEVGYYGECCWNLKKEKLVMLKPVKISVVETWKKKQN